MQQRFGIRFAARNAVAAEHELEMRQQVEPRAHALGQKLQRVGHDGEVQSLSTANRSRARLRLDQYNPDAVTLAVHLAGNITATLVTGNSTVVEAPAAVAPEEVAAVLRSLCLRRGFRNMNSIARQHTVLTNQPLERSPHFPPRGDGSSTN